MARSRKPVPVQDLLNELIDSSKALDSTKAGAFKITRVDSVGSPIEASSETISSSASRIATLVSADQINRGHIGAYIFLDINSADSSGNLIMSIQAKVPGGGSSDYVDIFTGSSFLPSTGASIKSYLIYPSGSTKVDGGLNGISSAPLPRTWRAKVTHNNNEPIDYSIQAYRLP